ncbi:MAG: DUF2066 domain-containing protein [Parvibaculales bacterium]
MMMKWQITGQFRLMKQMIFIICVLSFMLLPTIGNAGDLFEVKNVAVDARDKNATAARAKALSDGQKQAFEILLKRMTRQQDWLVLPASDTVNVEDYILSFRVQDEKNSNRRYLANLSFQFDMAGIIGLLNELNIPYIETQAKPALLIALLEDVTGYRLWEKNWWQESWQQPDLNNVPAPIVLPLGDAEDAENLSVEDILIGDTKSMAAIAAKYNADAVIIAHANATEVAQLDVAVYQYTGQGSRLFFRNFTGKDEPRDMSSQAVAEIAQAFSDEWKQTAIVSANQMARFTVAADYENLQSWLKMRDRLENARFIKDMTVHVLTSNGAIVSLSYTGSVEQLTSNLAQNDMVLREDETGWRLKLRR